MPRKGVRGADSLGAFEVGGLKTERHMTEEGDPSRRVSNLTSTGMLVFYFILAVLNVAILQFVLE